ncbi:hypothetical protein, partial [Brenneria goodwinii]|uniref:hypothetical protein n=1 Tax=Brenneria goodwinii TaxID=1109412 RepID=UPI0036E32E15
INGSTDFVFSKKFIRCFLNHPLRLLSRPRFSTCQEEQVAHIRLAIYNTRQISLSCHGKEQVSTP